MTGAAAAGQRTITVVTGSRAEYGLLRPVMSALRAHDDVTLKVVATGAHLLASQGYTLRDLRDDGFEPDRLVELVVGGDTRAAMGKSIGLGVIGFIDAFSALAPDCVVILGDRYEVLAAATAAVSLGLPLVHLEGGHVTEGAVDDSFRHAITKLAHLHLTAAEPYARRLLQMGEEESRVHVVGSTGIDNVLRLDRLSRGELEADLGMALPSPLFLVTHHPVTADAAIDPAEEIAQVLAALRRHADATLVFTLANADPGGEVVNAAVRSFVAEEPYRRLAVASLGVKRYLSLAALADVVVGNSSSGVIEIPSLGVPTVNIGPRQQGRLRSPGVIDCDATQEAIDAALRRALSPGHRAVAACCDNVMGDGRAADRIVGLLRGLDLAALRTKRFIDRPWR